MAIISTALNLKFSAVPPDDPRITSNLCQSFFIQEDTGAFDAVLNPGGWGGVNPAIGDAQSATLDVTLLDGTVVTFDMYPTFPNITGTVFEITNVMLGLGATDPIVDWISSMTYTVTGDAGGGD